MLPTELPTLRGLLRHGIYLQVTYLSLSLISLPPCLHLQERMLLVEEVDRRNYTIPLLAKDVRAELVSCWQRANA